MKTLKQVYKPVDIFRPSYATVINGFDDNCCDRSKSLQIDSNDTFHITFGHCLRPFDEVKQDFDRANGKKVIFDFSFTLIDMEYLQKLSELDAYGIDLSYTPIGNNPDFIKFIKHYKYINISGCGGSTHRFDFVEFDAQIIICNAIQGFLIAELRPEQRADITHAHKFTEIFPSNYVGFMTHEYNTNCVICVANKNKIDTYTHM